MMIRLIDGHLQSELKPDADWSGVVNDMTNDLTRNSEVTCHYFKLM